MSTLAWHVMSCQCPVRAYHNFCQQGDMSKAPAGLDDCMSGRLAKLKALEMATTCGLACKTSGTKAQ